MKTHSHEELRALADNSTRVNAWYPHGSEDGTVRGPYHRWFKCTGGEGYGQQGVATIETDVEFAAAAMNNLVPLLDEVETLKEKIAELQFELILMGRDPDAVK